MSTIALYSKIEALPESLKNQVLDYIEFLLSREVKGSARAEAKPALEKKPQFKAGFGGAKGMIKLAADWDEPLEDFKDYM